MRRSAAKREKSAKKSARPNRGPRQIALDRSKTFVPFKVSKNRIPTGRKP
jgi:hypothetical protein